MNYAGPHWVGRAAFDLQTMIVAAEIALANWDSMQGEGGWAVTREIIRQAVSRNFELTSSDWHIYAALMATARGNSTDETRLRLAAELETAEKGFLDEMAGFYEAMGFALGLRLRSSDLSYRQLAAAGASVIEGLALRRILLDANTDNPERPESGWSFRDLIKKPVRGPALGGGTTDWGLAAWTFLGVVETFVELDPAWETTEDRRASLEQVLTSATEELARVAEVKSAGRHVVRALPPLALNPAPWLPSAPPGRCISPGPAFQPARTRCLMSVISFRMAPRGAPSTSSGSTSAATTASR